MTNLLEIFQIAADYELDFILDTQSFFSKPLSRKKSNWEALTQIESFKNFIEPILEDNGGYTLTNSEYSVDFNQLISAIESGSAKTQYQNIRAIRSQIIMWATKEEFEEMQRLSEFWEAMECSLMVLCQS